MSDVKVEKLGEEGYSIEDWRENAFGDTLLLTPTEARDLHRKLGEALGPELRELPPADARTKRPRHG